MKCVAYSDFLNRSNGTCTWYQLKWTHALMSHIVSCYLIISRREKYISMMIWWQCTWTRNLFLWAAGFDASFCSLQMVDYILSVWFCILRFLRYTAHTILAYSYSKPCVCESEMLPHSEHSSILYPVTQAANTTKKNAAANKHVALGEYQNLIDSSSLCMCSIGH